LPTTTGGNPQGLSKAFNLINYNSKSWSLSENIYGYEVDFIISKKSDSKFIRIIKRLFALRYLFISDIVFFSFGSTLFKPNPITVNKKLHNLTLKFCNLLLSILQNLELYILKMRNVLIMVQYQGDDARQGDFCLDNYDTSIAHKVRDNDYYNKDSDQLKRKQITLLSKFCHKIYALNPDLMNVLPAKAEFMPYGHFFPQDYKPIYNQIEKRPLRIGHAPTHRGAKGSEFVIDTMNKLKISGYDFEFILIEGLKNEKALKRYEYLDILVDQLYAGWYGGLAVECMALGKPVCSYIRESDLGFIPQEMCNDLPIVNVTEDTLEEKLVNILEMDREELLSLAKVSRHYVEKWHDPIKIVEKLDLEIQHFFT